jgi:NAD(P)-dependent dehydrogenase (short-subunit alcohol dehydrogenase family)
MSTVVFIWPSSLLCFRRMDMVKNYIALGGMMRTPFLEGRAAIVTGSSRGIGREIALALAEAGAKVMVCCNSGIREGEDICTGIRNAGGNCALFQGDLTEYSRAKCLVEKAVELFGGLDILVNNAGITDPRHFSLLGEEDWDRVEKADMKSAFNCCHHAMPHIAESGMGRVLNISSVCGKSGGIGAGAHYCAAKAGMIGFTKALANQYADRGITINAIAPAMIDTDMITWRTREEMDEVVKSIPLGRIGRTSEVALPALFLCSPFASFITGYTMDINGGLYMD